MKKIFLLVWVLFTINLSVFANVEVKDYQYYQKQIQGQRIPFNASGLVNSILKDRKDVVIMFTKSGLDLNKPYMGMPIVFFAVQAKDKEILDILLNNGADVEASSIDCTLLLWAINQKSSDAVSTLIKHKVDVNRNFKTLNPLEYAIGKKQTKIVELLLKNGVIISDKAIKKAEKSKDEYLKELIAASVK